LTSDLQTRLRSVRRVSQLVAIAASVPSVVYWAQDAPELGAVSQALIVLNTLAWAAFIGSSRAYLLSVVPRTKDSTVTPLEIDPAKVEAWEQNLDIEVATFLLQLLTLPQEHTRRITQRVGFEDRSVSVSTSKTIDVPESLRTKHLLLPAFSQKRGKLADSLRVVGPSEERLSTLTQTETAHVLLVLARIMIDELTPRETKQTRKPGFIEAARRRIELGFVRLVTSNATDTAEDEAELLARDGGTILKHFLDDSSSTVLRRLVTVVSESYPVVVVVPPMHSSGQTDTGFPTAGVRLRVDMTQPPARSTVDPGALSAFASAIRSLLYVVPPRFSFPLAAADEAQSYHLQVDAPEGLFFYELRVVKVGIRETVEPADPPTRKNQSGQQLQRSAHFYTRGSDALRDYFAEVSFKERLPGSVSVALLWSTVTLLLATSVLLSSGVASAGVILILFPALFAGLASGSIWQGLSTLHAPFGGRLASRLSSLLTLALSVWALIQASLDSAVGGVTTDGQLLSWILIIALSATNTLFLSALWVIDASVEQWFLAG